MKTTIEASVSRTKRRKEKKEEKRKHLRQGVGGLACMKHRPCEFPELSMPPYSPQVRFTFYPSDALEATVCILVKVAEPKLPSKTLHIFQGMMASLPAIWSWVRCIYMSGNAHLTRGFLKHLAPPSIAGDIQSRTLTL